MANPLFKSLALAAAIASAPALAQTGSTPAQAGATPAPPSVTAPAPNLTAPTPNLPPGQPNPSAQAPLGQAPAQPPLGQAPAQPLGVPFDRSREANYRRDMNACAAKTGVDLQTCQNMVNNQYEVDPNSIRMLPPGTMLR